MNILFTGGPWDGLVLEPESVEEIPHTVPAPGMKFISMYLGEDQTWWEFHYLLHGNIARYSGRRSLSIPPSQETDVQAVEALLMDPRTKGL